MVNVCSWWRTEHTEPQRFPNYNQFAILGNLNLTFTYWLAILSRQNFYPLLYTHEKRRSKIPVEINGIVEKIVASIAPEKVILFGSHAHGNATPDSDLDLLVIMETDLPLAERNRKISRLLRPRRLPMDIVVKNPKEIQKSLRRVDPFIHEILKKGVVLYARSEWGRRVA